MDTLLTAAYTARAAELVCYSPYHFLRAFPAEQQLESFVKDRIQNHLRHQGAARSFITSIDGSTYAFLYTLLTWDSDFFHRPVIKLFTVLYADADLERLTRATQEFRAVVLAERPLTYCFAELPSEDIVLIQALGRAGFGLVETRCFFYKESVQEYDYPRFPVRFTTAADAEWVGEVSATMRNEFDRFHADRSLKPADGDRFLRAYAEAAVRGYCDAVLVPDEPGMPAQAFLAVSDLETDAAKLGVGLARVVLTAVGPQNRGWHLKLVSETVQYARQRGAAYVLMTTQSTNRAVFRTAEKLGWHLGGTGHVLSVGDANS